MFKSIQNFFKSLAKNCKDSYEELAHKTTWPTRKELTHSAIVVLIASIIIALVVFAFDSFFHWFMKFIYNA
ncbi:MAG: preprotein translocase subunit SecE [Bacteroidales bacterium]|nr:preprotein translocase subunit SecE [Candidatus Equimonas faecalis]